MQARHIRIDLNLVHDVHVRLSRQAAARDLIERKVLILAFGLTELGHRPVDAAKLQELPQLAVIDLDGIVGLLFVEVEARTHHYIVGHPHQGSLDFNHILHNLHGLMRNVVDEWYALWRDRDAVHAEVHEVADTRADAAVEDEDVLGHLQFRRHLGLQDRLELGLAQEERLIVLHPHHVLEALVRDFAEGGLEDLVRVLQLIEEGPQALHLVDHRVVGDLFGGVALAPVLHIQLRVLRNVEVLVGDERPVVHQHRHVELLGHHIAVALDVEEALHPPAHRLIMQVPMLADHAIPVGLFDIALEALNQVLFVSGVEDGLRSLRIQNLVHLNLQHLAPHIHPRNLHMIVGRVDGRKVLLNLGLQLWIIHRDPGPQSALGREDRQLFVRYLPAG